MGRADVTRDMRSTLLWPLVAFALLPGCSKHDCELEGDAQKKYWGEIALTTKGAEKCLVSEEPLDCTLDEERCTPKMQIVHDEKTQAEVEKSYQTALEKQGWERVGEKKFDDGSKIVAYGMGDEDELLVSFGSSILSKAMAGDDGIDVTMVRRPENADNSILDKYRSAEE